MNTSLARFSAPRVQQQVGTPHRQLFIMTTCHPKDVPLKTKAWPTESQMIDFYNSTFVWSILQILEKVQVSEAMEFRRNWSLGQIDPGSSVKMIHWFVEELSNIV